MEGKERNLEGIMPPHEAMEQYIALLKKKGLSVQLSTKYCEKMVNNIHCKNCEGRFACELLMKAMLVTAKGYDVISRMPNGMLRDGMLVTMKDTIEALIDKDIAEEREKHLQEMPKL